MGSFDEIRDSARGKSDGESASAAPAAGHVAGGGAPAELALPGGGAGDRPSGSFDEIRAFLGQVRRRLGKRAVAAILAVAASCLMGLALLGPLVAAWAHPGAWWSVTVLVAALAVGLGAGFAIGFARSRLRGDPAVARWVGERVPDLASDLMSSVELERELAGSPAFSPALARELARATAARVDTVDVESLLPERTWAKRGLVAAAAAVFLATLFLGDELVLGWRRLVETAPSDLRPFGASYAQEPIVGDVMVRLEFPTHMARPPLELPTSSGDILAPKGTKVTLSTTALMDVRGAKVAFDDRPAEEALDLAVDGRRLSATWVLDEPGAYRFLLMPPQREPLLEAEPHRIEIEADREPKVELFAPAEELEVSARKRVELGYAVEDDYGLRDVTLVWREAGGREIRRSLAGALVGRTTEGRYLWDLSEVSLEPGARVTYFIESRDNDDVTGPKVGRSKTFTLRVFSPRERHQKVIELAEAVFEHAVQVLADRLLLAHDDLGRRVMVQRASQGLVAELGALLTAIEEDPLRSDKMRGTIESMRKRLDKLVQEEHALLQRADVPKLARHDGAHVAEMEEDVILLDDWLERQRLETALAISDEIKEHRERLEELLERYERAPTEEMKQEILQEIRALRARIDELQKELSSLHGETEDRFVHAEALEGDDAKDCMAEVEKLVHEGKAAEARAALEKCTKVMEERAAELEKGLRGMREDKFSEEEKALSEMMDEVRDLEEAQRGLVDEAEELVERYSEEAAKVSKEKETPEKQKARETLALLEKELAEVPREGLTPFGQEEYDAVKGRVADVRRMLDEGDVAEALEMARQAVSGLRTLRGDIEDDLVEGGSWSARGEKALKHVEKAVPLAEQLVKELEQATPRPEDIMSRDDQRRMDQLRRKQEQLKQRAERLKKKMGEEAGKLPGRAGEEAQKGLGEAGEGMGRAGERMQRRDPMGARNEARGAADKLAEMRQGMQKAARPTTGQGEGRGVRDEPVRIPGSEEYKAPEAFREDILDAMKKEKAPDQYKDQVRKYYEELVK